MVATASSVNKQTYSVSYGLFCGPLHGRVLRAKLDASGLQCINDPTAADIVICHSAGCWLVPKNSHPKLVIYVAPIMAHPSVFIWLKANLFNSRLLISDRRILNGSSILIKNFWYALSQPKRNSGIIHQAHSLVVPGHTEAKIVVIRNQFDPWQQPAGLQQYLKHRNWNFISLGGSHDNLWANPDPYIAIIQYYAKQLLATANSG